MDFTTCFWCDSHLDIGGVPLTVPPGAGDAWKCAIRVVEFVVIGTKEERGEGLLQRAQIRHHKDQRSTPSFRVIIIFFTLLHCILITPIIWTYSESLFWFTGLPCNFINIHVRSLDYLYYFIVILSAVDEGFSAEISHSLYPSLGEN